MNGASRRKTDNKRFTHNVKRDSIKTRCRASQLMFVACAVCALAPAAAFAHHSRANYDMTQEIVVEGTVADLAWKNPHIFMTVETEVAASLLAWRSS